MGWRDNLRLRARGWLGLICMVAGIAMLLVSCAGCVAPRGFPPTGGIQNFDVVDAHLYRGAQPNGYGLRWLRQLGVRTVVNLRERGDDWVREARECQALGMAYACVPMPGWGAPSRESVDQALRIIAAADGPVFVHCQHGCDRTGTVVACYRIVYGESAELALEDARFHGMSRWESGMRRFVLGFRP